MQNEEIDIAAASDCVFGFYRLYSPAELLVE